MSTKILLVTCTFNGDVVAQKAFMQDRVVLGRGSECDVTLDNPGISREHAEIVRRGNEFVVRDLNSSNGTYVNQTRLAEASLGERDTIQIGKYLLHTSVVDESEADTAGTGAKPWQRDQTIQGV